MSASRDAFERHRWTVAEYRRMGETGTLAPDSRVELIEGEIIDMPPIGSLHAGVVGQLTRLLVQAAGESAIVWVQSPLELSERSEPEPDLMLLRPRDDFYKRVLPRAEDVLLAIEVADSTLVYDRDVKRPLYARHGVPDYWIVDIGGERVLTFREPADGDYAERSVIGGGRDVPIAALESTIIDLSGLFER